jgi:thiamine-monophosphate kinase
LNEFELIDRLQAIINGGRKNGLPPGSVGIGDDAAVLTVDGQRQLVVTTDTLVAGVHFPLDAKPADIGHKALAVNLSDLAAMGAEPAWFFLALTIPAADIEWLDAFAAGMGALAADAGVTLAGGDTTSGPLSITIMALGMVSAGEALLRSTARAKDLVVVSGTPGLAALALHCLQHKLPVDSVAWRAFTRPEPRLKLGQFLRGWASACIDISDGLAADLGHIASASQLGAEVFLDRLPRTPAMRTLEREQLWDLQLGGGDDYELCFTLPPALERELPVLAAAGGTELTVVGRMTAAAGMRCTRPDGTAFTPARAGYDHFRQ